MRKFFQVQVTNLPSRTSSLLSVLLRTWSAQRFSSEHFEAVPTPNTAEQVPSVFFVPTDNHGFCGGPHTFPQEKHQHFHVDMHIVTEKEISSKINIYKCVSVRGLVE